MKDKQKKGSFKKAAGKKAAAKKAAASKKRARNRKAQLVKRFGKKVGEKNYDLACISRDMLKTEVKVGSFAEVLAEARENRIARSFVRTSQAAYHKALSLGLALYYAAQAESNPAMKLKRLVEETGQRVTKRTTPELIVMRVVIDYGETEEDKKIGRKFANRDATALKHLAERRISPEEVVELGKKKGEGLETWARAKSGVKPVKDVGLDELDDEWGDFPKSQRASRKHEELEEDDEGLEDEHQEDEQEKGKQADRPAAIMTDMRLQGTIKAIGRRGHVFYSAHDDGHTTWGVVAIKLTHVESDSDIRSAFAKALHAYADQLTHGTS